MRLRFIPLVFLFGLVAIPEPVRARADDSSASPTLVVRVRPIDGLMEDMKYLTGLVGPEHEAKLDELLKNHLPNGFQGVDTKRPIGLYGKLDENLMDSSAVLLVPITDEKAFLALLEKFQLKAAKEEDGSYVIHPEKSPAPVYLRFANGYAYASVYHKEAVERGKLLDPDRIFSDKRSSAFSASFRIDQIPQIYQQVLLGQSEARITDATEKKSPGETDQQRAAKKEAAQTASQAAGAFIKEGGEVTVRFDVDRQAKQLSAEVGLSGKRGSALASQIAALGKSESLFAGMLDPGAAMNIVLHAALPENLRKTFSAAALEAIQSGLEKEKDQAKRAIGAKVLEAIKPTLNMGELDLGATFRGPTADKHYAFVAGLKLKEGNKIDQAVRDLVKEAPESERGDIKLDADSAGDVKIHQIDKVATDERTRELFGASPTFVAFRDDAVFVAAGAGALAALKEALAAKPGSAPLAQFDLSAARMGPVMPATQKDAKGQRKVNEADLQSVIEQAFGSDKDNDRIRFTLEGGDALKMKVTVAAPVVKFLHLFEMKNK